ncbi:MAG: divalent metal cation transporter, partial [Pirellulaceae bacterium]
MADSTNTDRELLVRANERGPFAKLGAFLRLSGPGWLQSAITLGGGSLGGALYLGVLGGRHMLWLQLVAIVIGVIMLSAIAYVTLSTRVRPYLAINQYVNPVLGVGWITATILANMIWILPQFSLCFDTLNQNLLPGTIQDNFASQAWVSGILGTAAFLVVILSFNPGWMSKLFDLLLKLFVGLIVVCFVAAIVYLVSQGEINLGSIWSSFIPDFSQWNNPSPDIAALINAAPETWQTWWHDKIINQQQKVIIGTTATAVGINMTFLLPYSMIARGWDKPYRGLARFDLITALAIPFVVVTSCIVLASAYTFHAKADDAFLSSDVTVIQESPFFRESLDVLEERLIEARGEDALATIAAMPNESAEEQE